MFTRSCSKLAVALYWLGVVEVCPSGWLESLMRTMSRDRYRVRWLKKFVSFGRGSATLHATGCEEMKRPEVVNAALEWELM